MLIGRTLANAGDVEWKLKDKQDRGDYLEMTGTLLNKTYGEEVNVVWLCPKQWNGRAVVWLDDNGKSALRNADGSVKPAVMKLVQGGATVLGADLLFQGGEPVKQTRVVANPREFAGYTFGYNHALFAQRTHDVLTIVKSPRATPRSARSPNPKTVAIAGWGSTGPIVAAARALAGEAIDRAAVDTQRLPLRQAARLPRSHVPPRRSEVSRSARHDRAGRSSPALARRRGQRARDRHCRVSRCLQGR